MDIVLLGVTVVSLIVAFIMSAAAWRFARDERARSTARVAALAAAASDSGTVSGTEDGDGGLESRRRPPSPVRETSAGTEVDRRLNATSVPVAVGESRPSAPWATARVSAFSSTSRLSTQREGMSSPLMRPPVVDDLPLTSASLGGGFLGSAVTTPGSGSRQRGLAVAAIILFAALVAGGYWTIFGSRTGAVGATSAVSDASPLELVSLRHERRGSRLAVTGLVRNPVAGAAAEKLTAVVFLFDQQGGFITSARANVDFVRLAPGDESPFVVSVDAPANVARYRVSFRNDAGIVPHIDRRGQEPIAPNSVSQNATAR